MGRPVAVNTKGTHVAAILESAHSPPEIAILTLADEKWRQVTTANKKRQEPRVHSELVTWTNARGGQVEGLLTLPVREGVPVRRSLPLITLLHGGPPNVSQDQYVHTTLVYPIGALVERGYAVFRPNFSGSLGYGPEFRTALVNNLGVADAEDVLTGIDHLVSSGLADGSRLALGGWSYGGYLAGVIARRDPRFKGVSIGAAPSNLTSYVGTTDLPDLFVDYLGGKRPYDDPASFAAASPALKPSKSAGTQIIVQHGKLDVRVPFGQGQENYYAFSQSGHSVRLSVYPSMGHIPVAAPDASAVAVENLEFFTCVLHPSEQGG
jgi:dipeptidyl aminopeptidase/acylaminoacyl peptidase